MRHHKSGRIFGREAGQRDALMKSLASSLILRGKIQTTEEKAKSLRPYVEKLITKAKRVNDPNNIENPKNIGGRRLLISKLGSESMSKKLIEVLGPKYIERKGGYTRIIKLPRRISDGAKRAQIEFV
jgi:large subunit ribosomal protein L17